MKHVRKWVVTGLGIAAGGMLMGASAWACVSGPVINLSTLNAKAGQEIGIKGTGFSTSSPDPVLVRFNALDGPVLATVPGPITSGTIDTTATIPDGTKPGQYVMVITRQTAQGGLSQAPVRSVFSVVGEAGANPVLGAPTASADTAVRANGLTRTDNSVSGGALALVALGVGGVAMFLAGMAALFAGRRPSVPAEARVRS